MTVSREVEAEIARLYHAEHWKVGTIAAQLHVHEDVVRRVVGRLLKKAHTKTAASAPAAMVPYVDFVRETLERSPKLCSTRLWDMLRERGFGGSARAVRRYVKKVRPKARSARRFCTRRALIAAMAEPAAGVRAGHGA